MSQNRLKRRLGRYITLFAIAGVLVSLYHAPNSSIVQRSVLKLLSQGKLKISAENIDINLLRSKASIDGLKAVNESKGRDFHADKIDLKYSLLGLLQGKIVIDKLDVKGAEAMIPRTASEEESSKQIGLKKLFFLRNIVIDDATLDQTKITLGENEFQVDTLKLRFKPRIVGDVELKIDIQGAEYRSPAHTMWFGNLALDGKTNIHRWLNEPPYVNDIKGGLHIKDMKVLEDLLISSFDSRIRIKDKRFEITDLKIVKDGKPLNGVFSVDLSNKTYNADINIPDPIKFPTLSDREDPELEPTIDTQGELSGKITAEGTGFTLAQTTGKAEINVTHAREGLASINVLSTINWKNGVATLSNSVLKIADGTINVTGSVNVPDKKIDLAFDIDNVPTEAVFGRFGNNDFHPIYGPASGSATFKGWGTNFKVEGEASTVGMGGYYKIKTDHAHAKVTVTYQELLLIGEASHNGKEFGDITLRIKYGPKVEGKLRPKTIHIDAKANDIPMDECFEAYGLKGTGFGKMVMDGPPRSFNSKLSGSILNGSFAGIEFQKVAVNSDMTYKKIKFTDGEVVLPNVSPITFSQPIQMDFGTGNFRMYGKPLEHLSFDVTYTIAPDSWKIANIAYRNLIAKGTYSPNGSNDLMIDGSIEGDDLQIFKYNLRDIGGTFAAKLKIVGSAADPSLTGKIELKKNMIFPRALGQRLENVDGTIIFEGHTIRTEQLTGNIENGSFTLKGDIQHSGMQLAKSNVSLEGRDLRYVSDDRAFRMEFDPKVTLKGSKGNMLLAGDIDILDGRYTKDFSMLGNLTAKKSSKKPSSGDLFSKDLKVDLRVHNSGDLAIKNNLGTIWFKADIKATGAADKPKINGSIDSRDGKIRYLGKDFTITNGFMEFKDDPANPYIEITAEHTAPSLPDSVVTILLRGQIDNLSLELSSIPAMEKRDIISLLMFGATEQDLRNTQYSNQFSSQMVAAQVSSVIEQPLTKLTRLDVFRLEASGSPIDSDPQRAKQTRNQSSNQTQISRIYLGKQLTDRLSVSFVTDVGTENSQQTFRTEYLVTDFLLFKGISATGQYYQFNVSLRFKER